MPAKNENPVYLMKTKMPDAQQHQHQRLEKEAYDAWFRAQVQASIDEPRPSIPDEEVRRMIAIKRDKLRQGKKL
ncbi:antitoxin PaaA2 family protein [Pseudomonas nunensis]|uniref:antitoxin PaaA2 family protein n=1 Tax=Pseudomonas nunensis TaxID=2961896 RepID=UPI0025B11BF8|nr:hypothetical protein [Pseudomonas nunensis]MDN3221893.1 hypothetical protein [Pseudomonas nunensis]